MNSRTFLVPTTHLEEIAMTSTLQPPVLPAFGNTITEIDALILATKTWAVNAQTQGREPKLLSSEVEDRLIGVATIVMSQAPGIVFPTQFMKVIRFAASKASSFTMAVNVIRGLDALEQLLITFSMEEDDKYLPSSIY
jgi:hypothetical protein